MAVKTETLAVLSRYGDGERDDRLRVRGLVFLVAWGTLVFPVGLWRRVSSHRQGARCRGGRLHIGESSGHSKVASRDDPI
jgi:hypothetical protein